MNIAFIHYHLKKGGVTTVLQQQIQALKSLGWNVLVLSGADAESPIPAPVITIADLSYDTVQTGSSSPETIARKVINAIDGHWPKGADVVHVHNPTLAKNRYLQEALFLLHKSGIKLLCQIHDFAEDGRPAAYYTSGYVNDCHYAAINRHDHQLLIRSGLKETGCHYLPNTIDPKFTPSDQAGAGNYVLYPVRAIRRKNIGEALLLSLFFDKGERLAITLPPNSPADIDSYSKWRNFAAENELCVDFEVGLEADFPDLMAGSRYVLTTSINEGFGFVYLEPWLAGKVLWGRLIPRVCEGFIGQGIELNHLYRHLWVDLQWLDKASLQRQWTSTLSMASDLMNVPLNGATLNQYWRHVSDGGLFDFGLLNEKFQQQIILRMIADSGACKRLLEINPQLKHIGPFEGAKKTIQQNSDAIKKLFHPGQYALRLQRIYQCAANVSVHHRIDKAVLASSFLAPMNLSLLMWEPFNG